jgi:hypothetical protein
LEREPERSQLHSLPVASGSAPLARRRSGLIASCGSIAPDDAVLPLARQSAGSQAKRSAGNDGRPAHAPAQSGASDVMACYARNDRLREGLPEKSNAGFDHAPTRTDDNDFGSADQPGGGPG